MQQFLVCPRCGAQNYMGQRFCAGCGAPLPAPCPYCGVYMSSASGFCTNCGARVGPGTAQPVKQSKPTSGWAKFGTGMFIIGVLCIVLGPIVIMLRPEAEQTTTMLIRCLAVGGLFVIVGLPLMFKG